LINDKRQLTNPFHFRHTDALQTHNVNTADWAIPDSWAKRIKRRPLALWRV